MSKSPEERKAYHRAYYQANKDKWAERYRGTEEQRERQRQADRRYHAANREKKAIYARQWRERNAERRKAYRQREKMLQRAAHVKRQYNLSQLDLYTLRKQQGDLCAICRKAETAQVNGVRQDLSIDHDHKTGAVRGLLCRRCNRGLGALGDNIDGLKRALAYLER